MDTFDVTGQLAPGQRGVFKDGRMWEVDETGTPVEIIHERGPGET